MVLKKIGVVVSLLVMLATNAFAQSYNEENTAMTNFILRMYRNAPFEGVKVFTDYNHAYLLSILSLDPNKYPNSSAMARVAEVKAMSQASRYFNGSDVTSDLIVHSVEKPEGKADTEIIEIIKEHSIGYVRSLELLTSFENHEKRVVFIYYKEIDNAK